MIKVWVLDSEVCICSIDYMKMQTMILPMY